MVIISEKNYIAVKIETFDPGLHDSMTKKVLRGGAWIFALRMINRGAGFVRTIILARLLSPTDFGLFGIALLSISALETFSQTGFQAALVQKKVMLNHFLILPGQSQLYEVS